MNPILRNILAVIAGVAIGSFVNMTIVGLNGPIIALPEGADLSTMEKLKESMNLFKPIHFIFPFLGHAVGTLVGSFITAAIAANNKFRLAMAIGIWFLLAGIIMVYLVGGPIWFQATDLLIAYIPMALAGEKIAKAISPKN